jgi:hypothetical protein
MERVSTSDILSDNQETKRQLTRICAALVYDKTVLIRPDTYPHSV